MANFVESPITRIFGGKFRSPVCAPNQPDLVPTEDWRSLHLDIQHDSIRSVQDTLAHFSQPQSVQVGASSLGNASHKFSSRRFLQYLSSISTASDTMRLRAV
ncbi:hypothetical protein BGY98DRAFT_612136 [Russula aff. rugulosa BPL654]|nr:hypothetical protein BGY98DRAFT_612136 [Russula aff. rugulosa BPL654]